MPMIQVRHVPDDVHRALKVRAAVEGRPLSDMVLDELRRIATRPTLDELIARLDALPPVEVPGGAAEVVREGRDG